MWCALLLGLFAVVFAEEAPGASETVELSKRESERGNVVIYGSSPGNYVIQNPDATAQSAQNPAYALQPELYINSYRKSQAAALSAQSPSPSQAQPQAQHYQQQQQRRPQYVLTAAQQLAALQQLHEQAAVAAAAAKQTSQQSPHIQSAQEQAYESVVSFGKPGHGNFYKPRAQQPTDHAQRAQIAAQPRVPQQSAQPVQPQPHQQFASSGIVDSSSGSFEEELAQLVAANRAQEQKYNAALTASLPATSPPPARKPAPQQYLKEITRPTTRPRPVVRYQSQPHPHHFSQNYDAAVVASQPLRQSPPLYRYVYQQEAQQAKDIPAAPQAAAPLQKAQYIQPQEYIRQPAHIRQQEDSLIRQLLANPQAQFVPKSLTPVLNQPEAPSRSQIYVTQTTSPYKRLQPQPAAPAAAHPTPRPAQQVPAPTPTFAQDYDEKIQGIPVIRIPGQRDKPLTQDEFQNLLQIGGYTATLLPSSPNSPHQEYLLQPKFVQQPQRGEYVLEQQESQAYQPQQQKKRPQYTPASA